MDGVYDWFAGLATIGGFLYFLAGFAAAYVYNYCKCKARHRKMRVPWHIVGIAIGVSAIVITTLQSSVAYNTAQQTAVEVQNCQREFNGVIRARAKISEENDRWSAIQRKALGDWLRTLIYPPSPYDEMDPNDPLRQAWALELTEKYSKIIQQAQREQDENLVERTKHPLPEPTCGR